MENSVLQFAASECGKPCLNAESSSKCGKPREIFCFSDLKGATPCNGLFSWLSGKEILYKGVTGINLPMLVCAVNHKNLSLELLLKKVLEAKEKGIQSLNSY